jgi:transposase-like protein
MKCVVCGGAAISERPGYRRFRRRDCGKQFNERTGGSLNRTQYPSDVIGLVVFWRLRHKLSLARSAGDVPSPRHRIHLRGGSGL